VLSANLFAPATRVLVIAPHTDDEFGCAGTISRFLRSSANVRYVALSSCEASVPAHLPPDILVHECRACTGALGIANENVDIWDFPVRYFPEHRQEILERFVSVAREWSPEVVLLPSSFDTHQDHATVYTEGFRAFKHATLLGYELPQNIISFSNSAFFELTDADLELKLRALAEYRSQTFRRYSTEEFIRGLACVRGAQINAHYAEAFEVVRLTMRCA
jgi:LmbE family N-acetylglucosaminyl deacetylase